MEEEFYNAFATPITIAQHTMLENEMGTMQKPPKLMNIEEYKGWEERFENWVQANYFDAWECVETKYVRPMNDDEGVDEKKKYKNEKMMISFKEISWFYCNTVEIVKNKKSLLKKEFDLFRGLRTESTKQIIERYCNLLMNMKRLSITKDNEELIEKLADALPHET
ncbi:hypothetical protein Hanom_Chr03g00260111 [Helianthus anomalus]